MNYDELKSLSRDEAIKLVLPEGYKLKAKEAHQFPDDPVVIVFGGKYWEDNDTIADFIREYVQPKSEQDVSWALKDITRSILRDPQLYENDFRKNMNRDYQLIFEQYAPLIKSPDKMIDWAESKGTFLWHEYILTKRRHEQFLKIKKDQNDAAMMKISNRIKKIYNFTEKEMIYLQYFCSQTKCDDLDPSNNTLLFCWSKAKRTGKTTVASYIVSFLNGEERRNESPHKSKLKTEMQLDRFDIPKGVSSRCVLMDEGGFHSMKKTYEDFKSIITSDSCEIEYKYKNSKRTKKCHRNLIFTSNPPPELLVQDEDERRILSVHFNKSFEKVSFDDLEKIWHEFVLECNLSAERLTKIYDEIIMPNSQVGEIRNVMLELKDILTKSKMESVNNGKSYFSTSNVMLLQEVINLKLDRQTVKTVLIKMYGEPDSNQRFNKINREIIGEISDIEDNSDDLPF